MTKLITLDFETFYSKEFSLSKITTERYIRSPEFETIGFGYKVDAGRSEWVTGPDNVIKDALQSLDIPNSNLICHNMAFDGAILAWRYGITPKYYFDTLSMARPITGQTVGGSLAALAKKFMLGEKGKEVVNALGMRREDFGFTQLHAYGEYCKNDVDLTYTLFHILREYTTPQELYIIDMMMRMYTDPVITLDKDTLEHHLGEVRLKKDNLMARIDASIGRDALMSNPKFAEVLKKLGVEPPTKISARTGKEAYAFGKTDVAFKALLEHEDERVQAVVSARLGVKSTLEETRTEAFIGISERGPLPILLNYYGAHTGRASGGDKVNLQNLPRGGALRKAMQAPEGHSLVAVDSSQIEARVVAWLAGQDELVACFAEGRDIYSEFATDVYGKTVTKSDKVERFVGKTCISEGTLVLSDSGWKPIERVSLTDKLWDGAEWVCHDGLQNNGIKPTLNLCGVWLTPDHQVWSGTKWLDAQLVAHDADILSQTLDTGAENLPLAAMYSEFGEGSLHSSSDAIAVELNTQSTAITSKISNRSGVQCVPKLRLHKNGTGFIVTQCQMMDTGHDYLIASPLLFPAATTQRTDLINIMEHEDSLSTKLGGLTAVPSSHIPKLLLAGTTRISKWIELMLTKGMNPATSGLCHGVTTCETSGESRTLRNVYDILNCGSKNRFTVLTEDGPIVVHNCILGLGYGMGKDKFKTTLKIGMGGVSADVSIDEATRIVSLYRSKYDKIVELWGQGQAALKAMTSGYTYELGVGIKLKCTPDGIELPNGMMVRYNNLRSDGQGGYLYDSRYGPVKIYGGKVIENVVQALARIVVFNQMAKIDQWCRKQDNPAAGRRYKVALTVHDEVVSVTPIDTAQPMYEFMMDAMSKPPSWAPTLPVACEGAIGDTYADCK